jgi:hypothetical protein
MRIGHACVVAQNQRRANCSEREVSRTVRNSAAQTSGEFGRGKIFQRFEEQD